MAQEGKKTREGFQSFCKAMPCGDMMRKMLENEKSGQPFNCAGIMSRMMPMLRRDGERKEKTPRETEENSTPL